MRKYQLPLLFILSTLPGCVEPYEAPLSNKASVLVVEGMLTDLPERQYIRLRRSEPNGPIALTTYVRNARVEVVVNDQTVLLCPEQSPGEYALPESFRPQVGSRYQLRFQTPDGRRYESVVEPMPQVPPIGRVSDTFVPNSLPANQSGILPANRLYVDFNDPAGERNFYLWRWTLWEKQDFCATCVQGFYELDPIFDCVKKPGPSSPTVTTYDYQCEGDCWEIIRSKELSTFADTYVNGQPVSGRAIGDVPLYQRSGALVEIEQVSLSPTAYRYYRLVEEQTERTGSLADTPPAPLVGNVTGLTDPNENVVGYFSVSAVQRTRYWLERRSIGTSAPLGLLGHPVVFEPVSFRPDGQPRPPLARCFPSATRTPFKPLGWR